MFAEQAEQLRQMADLQGQQLDQACHSDGNNGRGGYQESTLPSSWMSCSRSAAIS